MCVCVCVCVCQVPPQAPSAASTPPSWAAGTASRGGSLRHDRINPAKPSLDSSEVANRELKPGKAVPRKLLLKNI